MAVYTCMWNKHDLQKTLTTKTLYHNVFPIYKKKTLRTVYADKLVMPKNKNMLQWKIQNYSPYVSAAMKTWKRVSNMAYYTAIYHLRFCRWKRIWPISSKTQYSSSYSSCIPNTLGGIFSVNSSFPPFVSRVVNLRRTRKYPVPTDFTLISVLLDFIVCQNVEIWD